MIEYKCEVQESLPMPIIFGTIRPTKDIFKHARSIAIQCVLSVR